MNFDAILQAMETSPGSVAIRESTMLYPLIETTHVLALCIFLGLIALLDLRLTGLGLRSIPVSEIAGKVLPWALFGFVIMAISGALLFYSGPLKAAANIFFRVKVVMIGLTGINALLFHFTIFRKVNDWDLDPVPPGRARMAGMFSLILWCGVVICGRMQAYNWFTQQQ